MRGQTARVPPSYPAVPAIATTGPSTRQVFFHGQPPSCERGEAMVTRPEIDGGTAFDWGKTSPDYAVYRPGYPKSFYAILQAVGIGAPGQHILDLGTGTGVL